jgi:hypothetical protein
MSELAKTLGASAPPHEITSRGKTFQLHAITEGDKVAFGKKCFLSARTRLNELKDELDPAEYEAQYKQLKEDYENGEFELEGRRGISTLKTLKGTTLLLSLIANVTEKEAKSILLEKPQEMRSMMELLIHEAFPDVEIEKEPASPKVPSQE